MESSPNSPQRPGTLDDLQRPPRAASALGARLSRRARRARVPASARTASTTNTPATDLFLDKRKPSYVGGILEMANHRLFRFWGDLTEALRTGQPQNEAKSGGDILFAALYADPARLREFLAAMTGISRGANWRSPRKFPWSDYKTLRRRRHGAGRPRGPGGARPSAPARHRLRPARGRADLRGLRRRSSGSRTALHVRGRRLLRRPAAEGRRRDDGPHPPRLGSRRRRSMLMRKAYDALPAGGAFIVYESIIDDDRSQERLRPADEPEHADRDARRLRLHRRRLHRLDEGGRLPRDARRAPGRARTRWSSGSSSHDCGLVQPAAQKPKYRLTPTRGRPR